MFLSLHENSYGGGINYGRRIMGEIRDGVNPCRSNRVYTVGLNRA